MLFFIEGSYYSLCFYFVNRSNFIGWLTLKHNTLIFYQHVVKKYLVMCLKIWALPEENGLNLILLYGNQPVHQVCLISAYIIR